MLQSKLRVTYTDRSFRINMSSLEYIVINLLRVYGSKSDKYLTVYYGSVAKATDERRS